MKEIEIISTNILHNRKKSQEKGNQPLECLSLASRSQIPLASTARPTSPLCLLARNVLMATAAHRIPLVATIQVRKGPRPRSKAPPAGARRSGRWATQGRPLQACYGWIPCSLLRCKPI